MTPECRKMLWGLLRGDGQTFPGGGLVSLPLPSFEKADSGLETTTNTVVLATKTSLAATKLQQDFYSNIISRWKMRLNLFPWPEQLW